MVLAELAAAFPAPVTTDRLRFAIWGDDPTPTSRTGLQVVVKRLRGRLGQDAIVFLGDSYRLTLEARHVDAAAFDARVRIAIEARASRSHLVAHQAATDALELWRGPPFGSLADQLDLDAFAEQLWSLRRIAEEVEVDALLGLGAVDRGSVVLSCSWPKNLCGSGGGRN